MNRFILAGALFWSDFSVSSVGHGRLPLHKNLEGLWRGMGGAWERHGRGISPVPANESLS